MDRMCTLLDPLSNVDSGSHNQSQRACLKTTLFVQIDAEQRGGTKRSRDLGYGVYLPCIQPVGCEGVDDVRALRAQARV